MKGLTLPQLKDYRERLKKHPTKRYNARPLSAITHLAVHHSLTTSGSAEAFARFHVGNGWPGIGYHYVIEKDGTIKWCHEITLKTYHVGNSNRKAVGICMTGDFRKQEPTQAQWTSLFRLLRALSRELSISPDNIWGHNQFPKYSWKECPCVDMDMVRKQVREGKSNDVPAAVTLAEAPGLKESDGTESMWSLIRRLKYLSKGEILQRNPHLKDKSTSEKLPAGTPIRVQGPTGNFKNLPDVVKNVYYGMQNKGYRVFQKDNKPFNLNLVGIRTNNGKPNSFDDRLVVFWAFESRWHYRVYEITTDPGLYYLTHPLNEHGTAILKPGQYRGAYALGLHRKRYQALVQRGPVTVIRDFDRDEHLDLDGGKEQTGIFGINIHRASSKGSSTLVNKWSAGCQVFADSDDFADFMKLCRQAVSHWGDRFTYTLLNEADLAR